MLKTKMMCGLAAAALMIAMPVNMSLARPGGGGGGAPHVGTGGGGGGMARSFNGGGGGGSISRNSGPRVTTGPAVRGWSHREGTGGRNFRRGGAFIGFAAPYAYDSYYSDYYTDDDSCYWLRERALDTGSGYWWRRYRSCINDY